MRDGIPVSSRWRANAALNSAALLAVIAPVGGDSALVVFHRIMVANYR